MGVRALALLIVAAPVVMACAPDTRIPESSYQWERRQARIEADWRASQTVASQAAQTPAPTPAAKDKP
ncbi:hypothetical protein [Brevundimonas sp. SORGH_AS_0993]|uniref:hypothetical protein n=1 Tax=Brevundimonas sp. SORGH_AS_0993 TaxID=3041794 RepID=UPI00278A88BD|nr:hypothetical protein [Brevundimonas sp. SORGH_AS_0993]MDQ1153301.1 hypothetical protein [Brevundimonas sp. SORGH_AS_0993]